MGIKEKLRSQNIHKSRPITRRVALKSGKQIKSSKIPNLGTKSFSQNSTLQSIKKTLVIFQRSVHEVLKIQSNRPIKSSRGQQNTKLFSKLGYVSFAKKIKIIMEKVKMICYKSAKIPLYNWLMSLFKCSDPYSFLRSSNSASNIKFYNILCQILKQSYDSKVQTYEKCRKWLQKFILQLDQFEYQQKQQKSSPERRQIGINKQVAPLSLKIQRPFCPNIDCGCQLVDRKCVQGNHLIVICDQCKLHNHECKAPTKLQFTNQIQVIAQGPELNKYKLYSMPMLEKGHENNISQMLQFCHYKPAKCQKIFSYIPNLIECTYPIIVGEAAKEILKNRRDENNLALIIKQSSIKDAGLGVYATKQIKTVNTLVCSYLGQIGLGSVIPVGKYQQVKYLANDSIFTIGWLHQEIIIMAPNVYANVGRFINYNSPERCNLKSNLCLLKLNSANYQFAVFLSTTRPIKAGEELFYNYGPEYTNQE